MTIINAPLAAVSPSCRQTLGERRGMSIRFLRICSILLMSAAQVPPATAETSLAAPPTLAPMVEHVLPSVVSIAVTGTITGISRDWLCDSGGYGNGDC